MKNLSIRVVCAALVFVFCAAALTGCFENKNAKKKEMAEEIYHLLLEASDLAEKMGSDTYTAWNNGIHDADESGYDLTKFAKNLSLTVDELKAGAAYYLAEDDWDTLAESEKQEKIDKGDTTFKLMLILLDSKFSTCVNVVTRTYKVTGKSDEIKSKLNEARDKIRTLNEKYPDYDVCTKLKTLYTKIQTYYDYCINPTGSFNELQNIIQTFRQDVRDAKNELSFDLE